MPVFSPVVLAIAVFMPISSARLFSSGPPEFPRLSAASIWIIDFMRRSLRGRQRAIETGDDAGCERPFQAERIADGVNALAHAQSRCVAKSNRIQVVRRGINPQHGDVVHGILSDQFGVVRFACEQGDADSRRVADNVKIGQDVALSVEYGPRPGSLGNLHEKQKIRPNGACRDVDDAAIALLIDANIATLFGGPFLVEFFDEFLVVRQPKCVWPRTASRGVAACVRLRWDFDARRRANLGEGAGSIGRKQAGDDDDADRARGQGTFTSTRWTRHSTGIELGSVSSSV